MKFFFHSVLLLAGLLVTHALFSQNQARRSYSNLVEPGTSGVARCPTMEVDAVRRANTSGLETLATQGSTNCDEIDALFLLLYNAIIFMTGVFCLDLSSNFPRFLPH